MTQKPFSLRHALKQFTLFLLGKHDGVTIASNAYWDTIDRVSQQSRRQL
jgi:hypothetical protein